MNRFFTLIKWVLLLVLLPIFLFVTISAVLMLFPANQAANTPAPSAKQTNVRIEPLITAPAIALTHDLAHVNIVVDLSQSTTNWQTLVPEVVPKMEGYLLIGWGDRQTYISTPDWSDLKLSVAARALLLNTPSVLHLRYLRTLDNLSVEVTPLQLDKEIRQKIEKGVLAAFSMEHGRPVVIAPGYGPTDRFYASRGHYNLMHTCNSWLGDLLRQSGVPVSIWTPFSYNVVYSIPVDWKETVR